MTFNDKRVPIAKGVKIGDFKVIDFIGGSSSSMLYKVKNLDEQFTLKEFYPYDLACKGNLWYNALVDKIQSKNDEEYYFDEYKTEMDFIKKTNYLYESLEQINNKDYLLMKLDDGRLLSSFINNRKPFGKIHEISSLSDIIKLFISTLNSLKNIHQAGFIHGNLSPNNLYISAQNNAQIIDLVGIFEFENTQKFKSYQQTKYAPLEYLVDNQRNKINFDSDIYSVASIFFQIIYDRYYDILIHTTYEINKETGTRKLVIDEKITSHYYKKSREETVIKFRRILAKALIERYRDCDEVMQDLQELI